MSYIPRKKQNDLHNFETFLPRNHMFNVHTKRFYGTDYNFKGSYADPARNIITNQTVPGQTGIWIQPPSNRVIYIPYFIIIAEFLNEVDINSDLDSTGTLILSHAGAPICSAKKLSDLLMIGDIDSHVERSIFTPNLYTYFIKVPSYPAGRFAYSTGDYYNIKMSTGTEPDSNNLINLYFSFPMWETIEDQEI